jgi:hypothetical protein
MNLELAVYEAFQSVNVPADQARAVAEALSREMDRRADHQTKTVATQVDMQVLRGDTQNEIHLLRRELREEFQKMSHETREEIQKTRSEVDGLKLLIQRTESRILAQMMVMQRWTIGLLFIGLSALTVVQKLLA